MEITDIINFLIENWEAILLIFGIGGTAYEGKKTMDFFDAENLLRNVAPLILKLFPGVHTWTMLEETKKRIINAVPAGEVQSVLNAIQAAEKARLGMYDIHTTLGRIRIEYGVIMNPEILPSPEATQTAISASILQDPTSINSENRKIGLTSLQSLYIGGKEVFDGMEMKVSEIVGKTAVATVKGEDYGDVILGLFFDGELFAEGAVYTEPGTTELISGKMPDHNSDYPKGTHFVEVKQGYRDGWSSYDGTPGSSGDQNTFKEQLTQRFTITII